MGTRFQRVFVSQTVEGLFGAVRSDDSHKARRTKIEGYLKTLTPARRKQLEDQALASADLLLTSAYDRAVASGSELLIDLYRRMILEKHVGGSRKDGHTERDHDK